MTTPTTPEDNIETTTQVENSDSFNTTQPLETQPKSDNAQNLKNLFTAPILILKDIWQGKTATNVNAYFSGKNSFIILPVFAFLLATFVSLLITRGTVIVSFISQILPSAVLSHPLFALPYSFLDFAHWVGVFLLALVCFAALTALRVFFLKLVFAKRNIQTDITELANIYAFALTPFIFLLFALILLVLIPYIGTSSIIFALFVLFLLVFTFATELLIYIKINQIGRFNQSVFLPNILYFTLYVALLLVAFYAAFKIGFDGILASSFPSSPSIF